MGLSVSKGLIAERDFRMPGTRVWLKVLIFDTRKSMRRFTRRGFCFGAPPTGCPAFCAPLESECSRGEMVDPRYFAVVFLTARALRQDVITHEAVHAAFAFRRRRPRFRWMDMDNEEESICYPAGIIARMIHEASMIRKRLR